MSGLSLVAVSRATLRCREQATLRCREQAAHRGGFSCCRAQALGAQASVAAVYGLSSGGTQA